MNDEEMKLKKEEAYHAEKDSNGPEFISMLEQYRYQLDELEGNLEIIRERIQTIGSEDESIEDKEQKGEMYGKEPEVRSDTLMGQFLTVRDRLNNCRNAASNARRNLIRLVG